MKRISQDKRIGNTKLLFSSLLGLLCFGTLLAFTRSYPNNILLKGVRTNQPKQVLWALNHGANPNLLDPQTGSIPASSWKVLQKLQKLWYGHPLYKDAVPVLIEAIERNETTIVGYLLNKGADANGVVPSHGKQESTPLMEATALGNDQIVHLLLQHRANPNSCNRKGYTALDTAIWGTKEKIVELLLQQGANPNYSPALRSPLSHATYIAASAYDLLHSNAVPAQLRDHFNFAASMRIVQLLLQHGARVNAQADTGRTPLTWACYFGCYPLARELLKAGADPNLADGIGEAPLSYAVMRRDVNLCRLLVRFGANPYHRDKSGIMAWETATSFRDSALMQALEEGLKEYRLNHSGGNRVSVVR